MQPRGIEIVDQGVEAAQGKPDFFGLRDIADALERARMPDKLLCAPEPALGIDGKVLAMASFQYFGQAQLSACGVAGNDATANVLGEHAQVLHDVLGVGEDVTINALENCLTASIGGHHICIIDQSLPMRMDSAGLSAQNEFPGNVLFNGHGGEAIIPGCS